MKAGVITFPGSNCDDDAVFILSKVCEFQVETLWHKDTPDLSGYDLMVVPGGFSYGDYLRCGAIAGLSPIMDSVRRYAQSGKLLIGICNGFQILCEAGLLPGALAKNETLKFICKDVSLKVETTKTPWSLEMTPGAELVFPIAHGDGRYVVSETDYADLKMNDQILFTYVDNPNGSSYSIAGVCNVQKNIMGLMPHPERATDLRSRDGLKLWKSVTRFLHERNQ